jgi:hypothetical protein
MSKLVFNGTTHTVQLVDKNGNVVGEWPAYNNIDSAAVTAKFGGHKHLDNGTFTTVDKNKAHPHEPDPNGPYGSHGIVRFDYPGHEGIGLHSGRTAATHMPGAQHATKGCIRTTDDAMNQITTTMGTDPVLTFEVRDNNATAAQHRSDTGHGHAHGHKHK